LSGISLLDLNRYNNFEKLRWEKYDNSVNANGF